MRLFLSVLTLLLIVHSVFADFLGTLKTSIITFDLSGGLIIPSVDEREDQHLMSSGGTVEFPFFPHHALGVFIQGIHYNTPQNSISSISAGLSDRIFLHSDTSLKGHYLRWFTGIVGSDCYFPGNGSRLNFSSGITIGYAARNHPFFVETGLQHISNGYLRDPNIGINAIIVRIGLMFI